MLTSIKSVGSYVPSGILTNADLEKMVETSDTWIRERTGIVERRIAAVNETATDLAAEAAKDALRAAGLRPQDTDLIVCSTSTPDSMYPSVASRVQERLGAHGPAFDVQAACTGFLVAMSVAARFVSGGGYRGTRVRRVGIHIFARVVSLMVGQRVSDTTSGFRAVNRKALRLFAGEYPHDYPEVESIVLLSRHGLRMLEVPVRMRVRETGSSSITALRAAYYMIKVLLALFIGLFRRYPSPQEEQ